MLGITADGRFRTMLLHESVRILCLNCQLVVVAMVSCLYTATLHHLLTRPQTRPLSGNSSS